MIETQSLEESLERKRRIVKSIPVNALDMEFIQSGLKELAVGFRLDSDDEFVNAILECRSRLVDAWFGENNGAINKDQG